jgi:hypothetical protein
MLAAVPSVLIFISGDCFHEMSKDNVSYQCQLMPLADAAYCESASLPYGIFLNMRGERAGKKIIFITQFFDLLTFESVAPFFHFRNLLWRTATTSIQNPAINLVIYIRIAVQEVCALYRHKTLRLIPGSTRIETSPISQSLALNCQHYNI